MKTLIALLFAATATAAEVVSWDASPSPDVTGYKVYWATSQSGPWAVLGATNGLSMPSGMTGMFYYITATNDCCESVPSKIGHMPGSPNNVKVR